MVSDFKSATKTLRTSNSKLNIVAVNGCCYGRDNNPDKGDYFKYCGQINLQKNFVIQKEQ